jgi:MoxR-like ATPase
MPYKKIFDPDQPTPPPPEQPAQLRSGDNRDGQVYVYEDDIVLGVNIAIATGRPLLLYGPPGSGKSSLAAHVARCLGWRYHPVVITSRTQARDLLYHFDVVRRLSDAQTDEGVNEDIAAYIEPGALWWAFDRHGAARRGVAGEGPLPFKGAREPQADRQPDREECVVLIDEIDKADPDVPNNLLVPLGSYTFRVHELDREIGVKSTPLLVITTNDERELPKAFLRRCVILTLKAPKKRRLVEIAEVHFDPPHDSKLYEEVAGLVKQEEKKSKERKSPPPSTAEYLDALFACRKLGVRPGADGWDAVFQTILDKRAEPAAAQEAEEE